MRDFYKHMKPEKVDFIFRFKRFMRDNDRRPTADEVNSNFDGYNYNWVRRNVGSLKTIENRIQKGIY